jgi:hypothetical protein
MVSKPFTAHDLARTLRELFTDAERREAARAS